MMKPQRSKRERDYVKHVQDLRSRTRRPTKKYSRKQKYRDYNVAD